MNYTALKRLLFLSIRKKLIIAFVVLSIIPLSLIGIIYHVINIYNMQDVALKNLSHEVMILNERVHSFLLTVHEDVFYLSRTASFKQYIADGEQNNGQFSEGADKTVLQELLTFATIKKIYYQIHFIDSLGKERFKLRYVNRDFQIIAQEKLSRGSFPFYFMLMKSFRQGQVAFLPVELIDENNNKIPVITCALRIYNRKGNFRGIFIADVYAKELFRLFDTVVNSDVNEKIVIVNSDGYYLYHSEKKKNWSRLLYFRDKENLFEEYAEHFTAEIMSGKSGITVPRAGEIAAYAPLLQSQFTEGNSYYLFKSVNKKSIFAPVHRFAIMSGSVILLFLAISILFTIFATRRISENLKKLNRGAETIARGNYSHHLKIEAKDEIGSLAHQFNQMADALLKREQIIEKHKKQLEETVVERTFELKQEKEKLQAILDNVPSAFILLDEELNILSASAVIKNIAGVFPEEIIGKKCYQALAKKNLCQNWTEKTNRTNSRTMSFIETRDDEEKGDIFIEHISIPLTLNNQHQAYLEILTDITEQKKMNEHLLKMEKLVASGEMSAVISHEMRNSLTSIKMILQLQREASQNEDDRQSLEVALKSIYRMENVVENLLRFARPAPIQFRQENINRIINDCLTFLQPQFEKKRLTVQKKLKADLPHLFADYHQLKEAMINILLNSIQACDEKGKIIMESDLINLSQKIEDYAYSDFQKENDYKIILNRGRELIQVKIKDSGPGILQKQLNKIFDPFFTTKLNGTGLGLTMTKRTINQHGGVIIVNSHPDQETVFRLLLPVRRTS